MVEIPTWYQTGLLAFYCCSKGKDTMALRRLGENFQNGSTILNLRKYWTLTFYNIQQAFSPVTFQKPNHNLLEKTFSSLPTFHEITLVLKPRTDNILSHVSNKFKVQLLHKYNCWKTLQRKPSYLPISTFGRKSKYLYTEELFKIISALTKHK